MKEGTQYETDDYYGTRVTRRLESGGLTRHADARLWRVHHYSSAQRTIMVLLHILGVFWVIEGGLLAIVFGLMEMITAVGIRETFSSKWSLTVGLVRVVLALRLRDYSFCQNMS